MTRTIIIGLGLLGIAVVGRAALAFVGTDPVALGMCALMAAVLGFGIVELVRAAARLDTLRSELGSVTKAATEGAVDGASPELRGLLRSRLDRAAVPVPLPAFAPYLAGLLVMLGLLGTFLGLFETLRGARSALTNSGDLEALRAGLVSPMAGLVRSFGTSAAGVAASAVLGLASVFVRRTAQLLSSELALAVAGPLASLATSARELAAIEALAAQGRALPAAADALDRSVKELAAIGPKLDSHQKASIDAIRASLTDSVSAMEKQLVRTTESIEKQLTASAQAMKLSLETAVATVPAAAIKAVEPHVAKSLEASTGAATKHLDDVRKAVEKDVEARRASEAKLLDAQTKHLASVEKSLEATRESMAAAEAGRAERVGQILSAQLATLAESLNQAAAGFGPALHASTQPAIESLSKVAATFGPSLEAATAPVAEKLTAMASSLESSSARVREQAEQSADAMRNDQARVAELFDRLAGASDKVSDAATRQTAAIDRVVESATSRTSDFEKATEARLSALLDRVEAMTTAERERSAALDTLLRESTTRTSEDVARILGAHASGLSDELAKTQSLVHEAAGLVHAGGAELESLAAAFGEAVDRHRTAAEEWLANLGKVEAAVIAAGETAATDVLGQQLARTHEIFDRQLRFQNELLDRVRGPRAAAPDPAPEETPEAAPALPNGRHEPDDVAEPEANPAIDAAPEADEAPSTDDVEAVTSDDAGE